MEPAGIEPATSCLQSSTAGDAKESEMPEKSGDSGEAEAAPESPHLRAIAASSGTGA
jgi:hypothetical protein